MAATLNPYITFSDNTEEAMLFYQSVFGGSLELSRFGEYGPPEGFDPQGVMHASLRVHDGFTLMASDGPPGGQVRHGDNISISIGGDAGEREDLHRYFHGLAEGGEITIPLEKQSWGDEFGMVRDRFGIHWMVDIGGEQA